MAESSRDGAKVASKLVGCEVVLNPKATGMFIDSDNKISLSFLKGGTDRVAITETMNPILVLKAIKSGRLTVKRDHVDVTKEFGGPDLSIDWHRIPIVQKPAPAADKKDDQILRLINRNNYKTIARDVAGIRDYSVLERLLELETMGKNPSYAARGEVIDAIREAMKSAYPGTSEARKMHQEKVDVVKVK